MLESNLSVFSMKKRNRIYQTDNWGVIMVKDLYSHTDNSQGQKHILVDHLKDAARPSKKFAKKF